MTGAAPAGEAMDAAALARRLRAALADPRRALREHPLVAVALGTGAIQAVVGWRVHAAVPAGERLALRDSVIFEYLGWRLARGDRLYVDLWEVKPPLSFELTGLLAALSGGDAGLYHDLVLVATAGAAVACAVLAGALVAEATGDPLATVVGGLSVYAVPAFAWRATVGFKAKYVVVAAGLLAVLLHHRARDVGSGAAAAAAVGTWQLGVGFPAVVAALLARAGSWRRARRFVLGLALAGATILAPVAYWGTLDAMVAETLLAPLLVGEAGDPVGRLWRVVHLTGWGLPVVVLGAVGLVDAARSADGPERLWAPAIGGWFAVQVLVVDLDAVPDLFPLLAITAVGVGLLVGREWPAPPAAVDLHPRRWTDLAGVALVALVVLNAVTLGGLAPGGSPHLPPETYDPPATLHPELPYDETERQYVFWNRLPPPSCRLFAGPTQRRLVAVLEPGSDRGFFETDCGQLGPALDALARRYG